MNWLILTRNSVSYAAELSAAIYDLTRAVRDQADVTRHISRWVTHPVNGQVALEIPDGLLPVHMNADGQTIAALIGDSVSSEERSNIIADVAAARGARVSLADFVPASLVVNVRTTSQMRQQGWFDAE